MILFKNIQNLIIENIHRANFEIKIAVTWFTNTEIFQELIYKLISSNCNISLIVLNDRINNKIEGNNFQKFIDLGGKFYYSTVDKLVHHKFCIIDEKIVLNGSYNWTFYAEHRNSENLILLENPDIIKEFSKEFQKLQDNHEIVTDIEKLRSTRYQLTNKEILDLEYYIQADILSKQNKSIEAISLLTEVEKHDLKKSKLKELRSKIVKTVNSEDRFRVSPFTIGLEFGDGFSKVINEFDQLPINIEKTGRILYDKQSKATIQVKKYKYSKRYMFDLELENLFPRPKNSTKVLIKMKLEQSGTLIASMQEIDNIKNECRKEVNIKNWL